MVNTRSAPAHAATSFPIRADGDAYDTEDGRSSGTRTVGPLQDLRLLRLVFGMRLSIELTFDESNATDESAAGSAVRSHVCDPVCALRLHAVFRDETRCVVARGCE
jgi:hypothetical protein